MAAPAWGSASETHSTGAAITAPAPASTAENDLLLAFLFVDTNTPTVSTVGSGYTLVEGPVQGSAGDERVWVYRKLAGASEGDTTWQLSVTNRAWSVIICRITGVDTTTPVNASANRSGTSSSTQAVAQATTTVDDCLIVGFISNDQTAVTPPYYTPPSGTLTWTERLDSENANSNQSYGVATAVKATAGQVPADTWGLGSADSAPLVCVAAAPGSSATLGAGVAAFGGTFTASGIPETFGAAAAAFGFTGSASGQPRTFGVAAASLGGTFTALGIDRALGAAVAALGFTGSASGVAGAPPVTGVGTGTFGGTFAASGLPTVRGAALATFGFTGAGLGQPRTFGAGAATLGGTFTAAGIPRPLGVATAAFGFTGTAQGVDRAVGLAVAAFGFTGSASGTVSGGTEVFGVGVAALGFTGTASGVPETFGVAAALFGFTGAAAGIAPVTTPDGRTFAVVASNRTGSVPADPARVITPPASPRTTGA